MRALSVGYDSSPSTSRLLHDVRSMVRHLLRVALDENHRSAIALRKETAAWFAHSWRSRYAAHWHHSACSMAVGIARSYWRLKRTGRNPGTPRADRLVARADQRLCRIRDNDLVLTIRPGIWLRFPLNDAMKHKYWEEWSQHRLGEVTLLPRSLVLPFQVPEPNRLVAPESVGVDLNLNRATVLSTDNPGVRAEVDLRPAARIQAHMRRKRESVQNALPTNLERQRRVVRRMARRERNRVIEVVRKEAAPAIVGTAEGRNIVFEDLSWTTEECTPSAKSRDLRRRTSRWIHGLLQREVERRSPYAVVRVNARGTSSECPRCGGSVSHPEWRRSVCGNCEQEFDRDFAASSIIVMRGELLLRGQTVAPSVVASLAERSRPSPERVSEESALTLDARNGAPVTATFESR